MKEQNLKLLFYLKRGAKSKESRSPIMARLTIGRTMSQFSCKVVCSPKLWDSRKNRLVGKSAEAVAVNAELDRLQLAIHQTFEGLRQRQGSAITADEVKHLVLGLNSDSRGLLYHLKEYIERYRERVGIDRSAGRYKSFLPFLKYLEAFIK